MSEIERARDMAKALYKGHLDIYRKIGPPWNLLDKFSQRYWISLADVALSAQASRVAELEGALRPFLDLRHQSGAHGVISKKLDDMQPLTVTVTKAQFRAAFEATGRDGEG